MGYLEVTEKDFDQKLRGMQATAVVKCRFIRPTAGTMPSTPEGVDYFVGKYLGIEPGTKDHANAVNRILREEIGEREDDTPKDGELKNSKVYDVKLYRRSDAGYFFLGHMVKACLKVAATRLGLFVAKRGTKGDVSELGAVRAHGCSLLVPERPWEIYAVDEEGRPVDSYFDIVKGTVSGPKGSNSISSHVEFIPEGSIFEFEFRWLPTKLTGEDVVNMLAACREIGIGGGRPFDLGQFEILHAKVDDVRPLVKGKKGN